MAGNVLDSYSGDINGTAMNWKDKLEYRPNFTKDYITNQLTNEEIDKLTKLNELHKSGVLSDEEFEAQKNYILHK